MLDSAGGHVSRKEHMHVPEGIRAPFLIAGFENLTIAQSSYACNALNLLSVTLVGANP